MANTVYEIPLVASPQTLSIRLAGIDYNMTLQYQDAAQGGWCLDIADGAGNSLVAGIPLVTGADLLAQYAYLGFAGQLRVASDGVVDAVPTFANLGSGSHLYFLAN